MRRGEVWWVDFSSPIGRRPAVLLSRDEAYAVRNAVTVAEVTTVVRDIPVEVKLDKSDGLPKSCVVNLDTIVTIRKDRIKERISLLKAQKIAQINIALKFALGL
ncbi:type II toxin-antitoxin system PemK/MazF family toxin [Candidatus Omnitrophota bacterium]